MPISRIVQKGALWLVLLSIRPTSFASAFRPLDFRRSAISLRPTRQRLSRPSNMPVNMVDPQEIDPLLREPSDVPQIQKASTGQRILDLAVPAAAALLIDPLMTLADTAFVGRFSGESPDPLAGMGSAAALLRFSFYIFNFLCTATTPLISARRAAGDEKGAIEIGGQALSFAFVLGATVTVTLLTFKQPLLRIMGTSITGEDANHYALAFLSVRALAAPAVLLMEASTGIMRGYLDTKTPIFVLFGANIVNLVLDVLLIVFAGLGPMGAAIATTSAEWITAILYLAVLAGRLPSAGGELGRNRTTESGETVSVVPLLELPTFDQVKPLVVASSSVLLRTLVLQVSLSAATAMAARGGSGLTESAAASVAAHQIGIQLWLICSFFCDSLAAASQGLVADALGRKDTNAVRDVSMTVFQYSLVLGLGLALLLQVGLSTDVLSNMFTQDPLTRTALSHILPLIVLAQPLNSLVFAADGVLQGASEFPFQAKAMLVSGSTAVATFLVLEVVGKDNGTLFHVWIALIALQLVRGLTSLYKIVDRDGPIDLLNYKY